MLNGSAPTQSSTNGRSSGHRAPAWFRGAMGALSVAAPPLAAAVAERMFVRPPARRLAVSEAGRLGDADSAELDGPAGPIRTWRWQAGPGTVLLAHGWGGRGPQLGEIARTLVGQGYSALAWDMPGHGDRSEPTNLLEMAETTAHVARQVPHVAGVVAHSFGTAATLVATARHGLPVPRFVALAPAACLESLAGHFATLTGFTAPVVERMRARLARRLRFEWEELEATTIAPTLVCRALVIHDRDDERIPFAEGRELSRLLPGAELLETRGLGHRGPLRDPGVLERIGAFFGEE